MGELFAGHYELVDTIGLGGTGAVWRAWDQRQQMYVAAKVVRQADAPGMLRFVRQHATSLHHPHILLPRAWAGSHEHVLFATDLVRGGSVASLLAERGPLPPVWVAAVLDQVLDALSGLHEFSVVHRDLRTTKLLLEPVGDPSERPHVWLSGFAAAAGGDARNDLYRVGMIAAEMLTGLHPDPAAGVGPAPLEVPGDLWVWVREIAAPEISDRPASATVARELLAGTGLLSDRAWDSAGVSVEVPDRLGSLPEDWGPDGPGLREPEHIPASTVYEDLPQLPRVRIPEQLVGAMDDEEPLLEETPSLEVDLGDTVLEPVDSPYFEDTPIDEINVEAPLEGPPLVESVPEEAGEVGELDEVGGWEESAAAAAPTLEPPEVEAPPPVEPVQPERPEPPPEPAQPPVLEPVPTPRQRPVPGPRSHRHEPSISMSEREWQLQELRDHESMSDPDVPPLDLEERPPRKWPWVLAFFLLVAVLAGFYFINLYAGRRLH